LTPQLTTGAAPRGRMIDRIVAGHDHLMQRLAGTHAPEFLEIDVTMPQAKVLYLVVASGGIRMSELSTRLGVSLSTVSGLVERLVEHGLAVRHEDPADRRQVVVSATQAGHRLIERFRELNAAQLRTMLESLSDDDLVVVERSFGLLAEAVPVGPGLDTASSNVPGNEVNP
jgi:DNA-binding MarR family transcriptional regulator